MAFQYVGQLGRRVYLEGLWLRVHLDFFGREHDVAACGFELLAVGVECARVSVKVFVRRKLEPVDKDGGYRDIAQRFGLAHQGQVACVQVAHGRHDGGVAVTCQLLPQVGNGVDELHA